MARLAFRCWQLHIPFEEIHISSTPLRPGPTELDGGAPTASPQVSYCTPTRLHHDRPHVG